MIWCFFHIVYYFIDGCDAVIYEYTHYTIHVKKHKSNVGQGNVGENKIIWIYLVKLFYKKVTCLFIAKYIHFMICDRITHILTEFHRKVKERKKQNLGGCLCKKNNQTSMTGVRFYYSWFL